MYHHKRTEGLDQDSVYQFHDRNYFWGKRYHYFIYIMMIGNTDAMVNYTIDVAAKLKSGGALILCIIFATFFLVLPVVSMESFIGRYTKKTNGQMYKMVPLFIGYSTFLVGLNVMFIPLESLHISFYLIDFISVIGNTTIMKQCFFSDSECYDYKEKGPLNDTCHKDIFMGLTCEDHGVVRYPMQYNFYKFYRDPNSGFYPVWKLMLGLMFAWLFIWLIVFLRLRMAGLLLFIVFIMNLLSNILIFILALAANGTAVTGIYEVTSISISSLNLQEFTSILLMSFQRIGLVIPMGHMTYASRLHHKHAHNFFFVLLNLLYGIWTLIVAFAVCGVIAGKLGVKPYAVTVKDMGLVMVIMPEFLAFMKSPFIYVLFVYFCAIFKEIVMAAVATLMFFYNILDFFPSIIKFEKYVKVVLCIVFLLISLVSISQHANMIIIPVIRVVNLIFGTNVIILVECIMVFYLYGINRLSDDMYFMMGQRPNAMVRLSWILIPLMLLGALVVMIWRKDLVTLEQFVLELKHDHTHHLVKYIFLGMCVFILVISLVYLGCQLGTHNVCEQVMKPNFYWGPHDREDRMDRKNFSPATAIRSQPIRERKYRTVIEEDVSKTVHSEDKWKVVKDIDDLEKALKGVEEDDAVAKSTTTKVEEQKGRIFSDAEYFGGLDKISHVVVKTSGKVSTNQK